MLPYPQHHLLGQGRNTLARKALAISRTRRRLGNQHLYFDFDVQHYLRLYQQQQYQDIVAVGIAEALLRAIPSLDIVLTPNGFGIVSTNNITPASKPRIDRLIGSMLSHRDDCIAALLPELVGASQWLKSPQSDFFGATLFPDLGIVDALGGATGSRWEKYLELRSQVIDLEASLTEEWLSPELMSALRSENLRGDLTEKRSEIVRQVKAQIVGYLRSGSFNSRRLADIVNYIRLNESDFAEWYGSKTAELFAPPVFKNIKKSSGFFF